MSSDAEPGGTSGGLPGVASGGRSGEALATGFSLLVGALLGVFVAATGSFVHAAFPVVLGPVSFAGGALIALALVAALLAGQRLAIDRTVTLGGAIGVLVAIAVLAGFPGATGTVLIAMDAAGWTWLVGAALISIAAVALPARTSRSARRSRGGGPEGIAPPESGGGPEGIAPPE